MKFEDVLQISSQGCGSPVYEMALDPSCQHLPGHHKSLLITTKAVEELGTAGYAVLSGDWQTKQCLIQRALFLRSVCVLHVCRCALTLEED